MTVANFVADFGNGIDVIVGSAAGEDGVGDGSDSVVVLGDGGVFVLSGKLCYSC